MFPLLVHDIFVTEFDVTEFDDVQKEKHSSSRMYWNKLKIVKMTMDSTHIYCFA